MDSMSAVVLDVSASSSGTNHASSDDKAGDGGEVRTRMLNRGSLTMVQMLLLTAVVCGLEIVACAGFTYIPPMLLKAGYSEENMGYLLGLGPLLGFVLVPMIGRASDRCYSQFGRRRPFILGLSALLVVALYLIPFGEYFASLLVGLGAPSRRLGVWALTMGVVLLDFTTQACLTPCEALLNDATRDSDQNERIFAIYSLMISSGGILGYLLTAIDWTSTSVGGYFGGQEASIFSILIIVFTIMLIATLLVAQETPLALPQSYDIATVKTPIEYYPSSDSLSSQPPTSPAKPSPVNSNGGSQLPVESGYNSSSEDGSALSPSKSSSWQQLSNSESGVNFLRVMTPWIVVRFIARVGRCLPCAFVAGMIGVVSQTIKWPLARLGAWCKRMAPEQLNNLFQIPVVLRMLAFADFCAWTAIMGFNIYFTDYVGQVVYGGNPNALESSPEGRAYDDGVRNASWGLLLHCICSASFSFFIEKLTHVYGYRTTFTLGMVTFVFAMAGMVLIRHIYVVNLMAAITGFAYSTVTTIPFMLLSKYHSEKHIYFGDLPPSALVNPETGAERGIGADMAVLDWAYFLSQVALTAAMGSIVHVTGTLLSYMVTAGVMGILAVYYISRIVENEAQARRCILDDR